MGYIGVKPAGISSASQVETDVLDVDNIRIDGNTISSIDTNGNISLDPDGTGDVIVASGNVGIGETDPLGTVHIRTSDASLSSVNANADDLIVENNGNCGMSICSSTTGEGNINFIDSGDTNIGRIQYTHSDNNMIFRANDTEAMRITGSRLLVGTTNASPHNISSGTVGGCSFGEDNGGEIATDAYNCFQVNKLSSTSGSLIAFRYNATQVGYISTNGTTTAYNTSSDHRLKQGVEDMTGAIDRVKALAPKRFQFIADADTTVDGFLAHEAQAVVPEAVTGTHNEVDDDGNPVMQGIDQSKLVPLLTGALRETIAKIETLEARIEALETA